MAKRKLVHLHNHSEERELKRLAITVETALVLALGIPWVSGCTNPFPVPVEAALEYLKSVSAKPKQSEELHTLDRHC